MAGSYERAGMYPIVTGISPRHADYFMSLVGGYVPEGAGLVFSHGPGRPTGDVIMVARTADPETVASAASLAINSVQQF